mgnify:CR=1 FL=1
MDRQTTTMIKSMTGYGRRETAWAGGSVVVELRSVNHRFCEVVIRLPKALFSLEEEFKRKIQHRCTRGRTELTTSLLGVAHRSLPCGTLITFRNPANGRTLTVPVVDRGPYVYGRQWDLTGGACLALGHCYTGAFGWKYAAG